MSCLKLSYNEKDECLEQLVIFYGGAYEKSATAVKFCTNYYPFGLQHSTSWTRISDLKNNFLYNAGAELNEQTKNYEMFYRHYDPALGRMNGIDPVAAKYSSLTPYNYSFNDPIAFNDPMGDDPNRERREFDGVNWEQWMGFFRDENPHHWHRGYFTEGGGFSVIENKVLTYDPAARISQGIFGAFNTWVNHASTLGNFNLSSYGDGVTNISGDGIRTFTPESSIRVVQYETTTDWTQNGVDIGSTTSISYGLERPVQNRSFVSQDYNHFENGTMFNNVEHGLNTLWNASFRDGRVYKENMGYFTPDGLLILPNKENTTNSSRHILETKSKDGNQYVLWSGNYIQILGVIHTHPNINGKQDHTPGSDFPWVYAV